MIVKTEMLRSLSKTVAMVDGSFDPIHEGHIVYFQAAADLGYPVLCNVAPDIWTSKKHRVLLSQNQRSIVIDALRCIQFVHAAQIPTVDVLRMLQPIFYLKGSDWKNRGGIPREEQQACEEIGIEVRYLDTILNSSSELIKKWNENQ